MARRDRRRATSGALAASILVHLALFMVLAYQAAPVFRTPPEAAPDFDLQLVSEPAALPPPPAPQQRHLRTPVAPSRPHPQARPAPRPAARAIQAPPRPPPPHAASAPAAPPSRTTANVSAPGAVSGSQGAGAREASRNWQVQGEDDQDGVRRFLRATVGCSHEDYLRLNEQERASCDRRIGEDARAFGIAPDRLAGFIAAAEAQERARAGRTGPVPDLFAPCKGPGSNLDRSCIVTHDRPPDE